MAITVTQLSAYLAVVRSGSVTAAAEELGVTQPSVSAAVAALSRELGHELLERAGRGVQPTAAGRAFAVYATDVIGLLDSGRRAADEAAQREHREFRLGVCATAAETFVPALLRGYGEAHPEIECRLSVAGTDALLRSVLDHTGDAAIVGRVVKDERLTSVAIRRNEIVCVTTPDDPLVAERAIPAPALAERIWLLREQGSSTRLLSEHFLEGRSIEPDTLTLGSNAAVKRAVMAGLGVALLSAEAVQEELQNATLARFEISGKVATQNWFLVQSAIGPLRSAALSFVEYSRAQAAGGF